MQRVRFGLELDGERGWHARDALGESTVGPLGFLSLLETQLGLTRAAPSQAERVVQMRECLLAARTRGRFYERSFETDEMGTAATLLRWRDQWYEHGWYGTVTSESGSRLQDMAVVEALARPKVFPSVGERLNDVREALEQCRMQVDVVELLQPMQEFPAAWRRVLERLPTTPVTVLSETPRTNEGTVLQALQCALLQLPLGQPVGKVRWRDDGSLRVVRAESPLAAAQWLAAEIRQTPAADCVLVIEQAGSTVDAALAAMDQPLLGLCEPSDFRPVLQILPLVIRLLWEPLDFRALMQFLTHPVGPIRFYARRRLAEKMAATPGIGGEKWQHALRDIEAHYGTEGGEVLADIQFWLEQSRFTETEQVPLAYISQRVERLAELFRDGMADEDALGRAPWTAGYYQAMALQRVLHSLEQQGVQRIGPEPLNRLVSQASSYGSDNPLLGSEAGAYCRVRSPGAVIDAFDEVCWWDMAAIPLPSRYPWSPLEMQGLRASGVDLPDAGLVLERQAREWLHPILAARQRLTLMLPKSGAEVHPAWLMLSSLIEQPEVLDIETLLNTPDVDQRTTRIAHRPLPALRRWWQIPAGAIHGWERAASYTSLEQFFFNPYQWALNYPAKLKASALLDLPGDFQLLGNLAHRVVEQLYRQPDALSWSAERVRQWFDQAVPKIVREEGAVLLMRGRRADLEAFRLRFRRSLTVLHEIVRGAGARHVEPEKPLEGDTPLGALRGSSDLLMTLADGTQAIIDMKWAGNRKYRDKLANQTHIQLAIYARLIERNTSVWPAVAYFILSRPELLTSADGVFPGATPIIVPGSSTALLWERITQMWQWRRRQIESGLLEVVLEELEPTESVPPGGALPVEPLDPRYNPFVYLAGWGREA